MVTQMMVPLDGSELAERALPCAERLARATGAMLHLVRVAGPVFATDTDAGPEADSDDADFLRAEMRDAEAYLKRVRTRLEAAGLAIRARRITGTIAGALLDYAHEESIDLIVMTSHGRTGLARFPLGSIASRLVRHGTTPVLLVRAFGPPPDLDRAVVSLDGSPPAEVALGTVASLRATLPGARPLLKEMTVLRVVGSQEEGVEAEHYLTALLPRLQAQGLCRDGEQRCQPLVVQGDPATEILDTVAGTRALVVMATHGRSGPTRWALGSVADRVTAGGATAVLLVRAEAAARSQSRTRPQPSQAAGAAPGSGAQDATTQDDAAAVGQLLVPLDGSALAERALPSARRLATALGAAIHLVRVIVPPPAPARLHAPIDVYDTFLRSETTAARAYLAGARAQVSVTGTVVRTTCLLGDPASALLDYAHAAGIDLIVLCSHGRSGAARFALGSVAEHLLHWGTTPLVLVRAFGPPAALERPVLPLDGSARAEAALDMVVRLAPEVVQEVTLVRVIHRVEEGPEAERYLAEVARRLAAQALPCRRQVTLGDPAQAILEAAGQDGFVVMATHGRSSLTRWALGSVADRVARGGAAAVLLVRAGDAQDQRAV